MFRNQSLRKINTRTPYTETKILRNFNLDRLTDLITIGRNGRIERTDEQAFNFLKKRFNKRQDELIIIRKNIRNDIRSQIARNRRQSQVFLNQFVPDLPVQSRFERIPSSRTVEIGKLDKIITAFNKREGNKDKPFEFILKSTIANVERRYPFNHYEHFLNWFNKVLTDNDVASSSSAGLVYHLEIGVGNNLFGADVIIKELKLTAGGCNKNKAGLKKMKSSFYNYLLWNPYSENNNCLFACLKYMLEIEINIKKLRKQFNISKGSVAVADAYKIIHFLDSNITIVDYDTNEELDPEVKYIILKENHYYVLETFELIEKNTKKTKRGFLTFDFETRPTEEFHLIKSSNIKSHILKDTICGVVYRPYKQENIIQKVFITNNNLSSARQFVNFLNFESKIGHSYNVIAHNGGKFDFYFFLECLTKRETLDCNIGMRGTTIISINYRGNLFKDSYCFLTNSLAYLSESFQIEHGKICDITIGDKTLSSTQLCFYKPELTFNEFLDLQNTDVDFWKEYTNYCVYDCLALYEIWNKFTDCVNKLVGSISPYLLGKCPLMASPTIGSHSKKIIVEMNNYKDYVTSYKRGIEIFAGFQSIKTPCKFLDGTEGFLKWNDTDKYDFLTNFKRGGISHCNKAGKHMTGITGVDIASQYPASLLYAYLPTGKSNWTEIYDESKHGFYLIKDIVFETKHKFKPIALSIQNKSLDWASNKFGDLYVDSYMIKYLIKNSGLISFSVIKGLVSDEQILASQIFGKYVNKFYDQKKRQDFLKDEEKKGNIDPNERYNEALRSTIKLYLNAPTGKLVEDPSIHYSLEFDDRSRTVLNGVGIKKQFNQKEINSWIVAGIMVYSHSKRTLFEYVNCLPNKSSDVIHVETDGIYFSTEHLEKFKENLGNYKGDFPCKMGSDLGNLKIEKSTQKGQVGYFLGKKFYYISLSDEYLTKPRDSANEDIYRVKGIPQTTITDDGTKVYLVDAQLYRDVYAGKQVIKTFSTMRKSLFTESTQISTHKMSRVIRKTEKAEYQLYE